MADDTPTPQPTPEENAMTSRDEIKAIMAELEAAGIIVRTGDFRPNSMGQLEPVFVAACHLGMSKEEAERRLRRLAVKKGG
jgi:hypothetical protein